MTTVETDLFVIQGCIQTENGSIQMLWAPKKMPPKMKMRKRKLLLSVKISQVNNQLPCVLFKKHVIQLKIEKLIYIITIPYS